MSTKFCQIWSPKSIVTLLKQKYSNVKSSQHIPMDERFNMGNLQVSSESISTSQFLRYEDKRDFSKISQGQFEISQILSTTSSPFWVDSKNGETFSLLF